MSICKKIMSDFEVAVSVDKVAGRVDIMVTELGALKGLSVLL